MLKTFKAHIFSFLSLLFISYYASNTMFLHPHQLHGKVIVHSHPYKPVNQDNKSGHEHSEAGLLLIQVLNQTLITAVILLVIINFSTNLKTVVKYAICSKIPFSVVYTYNLLRAPPIY